MTGSRARHSARLALFAIAFLLIPAIVEARVVRVVIDRQTVIASGALWGMAGAYERIEGRVFFAFDPDSRANVPIVDIEHAPRNAAGEVEAWAQFVMYRPVDPAQASGVTLVNIVNRGGGAAGIPFSLGARAALSEDSAAHYGDPFLLRRGVTVVHLGWQFDIPARAGLLRLEAPVATDSGRPITGLVREQWLIESKTAPLSRAFGTYPASDAADTSNVLTVRDDPIATATVVPRTEWAFARFDSVKGPVPDSMAIYMAAGFTPGRIYELVYRAKNPPVAGLGLAAARDFISYLKNDSTSIAPTRFGIAFGSSQDGRFLRQFLYDGFNVDERGGTAYDGMFVSIAGGGRGSFDHRFAQPGRTAWGYDSFFYPIDLFPFTSIEETDPFTRERGALLAGTPSDHLPKIFYVDGGHEYWGRAASLTHTSPDGQVDMQLLGNERRYLIGSTSHGGGSGEAPAESLRIPETNAYRTDPLDDGPTNRALMSALIAWVTVDSAPPSSLYPTVESGDLVTPDRVLFPRIPGMQFARIPNIAYRLYFGPRATLGIFDTQPPLAGAAFAMMVPQVDSAGNDRGGIPTADVAVPIATYFPWQLHLGDPVPNDRMRNGSGTFVPLPKTDADRIVGDDRPSIEHLYRNRADYLEQVRAAVLDLVANRFLLAEDVNAVIGQMARRWDWMMRR